MKKLIYAIAAVCCIAMSYSCTKVLVAQYGYNIDELNVMYGYESEAQAFVNECNSIITSFDGTEFTETQLINAFDAVVAKYDNKHIYGTFKLWKDSKDNFIKSYTMNVAKE